MVFRLESLDASPSSHADLPQFTSLVIGDNSLTGVQGEATQLFMEGPRSSLFSHADLPKFKTLIIGAHGFQFYSRWELHNVNKYMELQLGSDSLQQLTELRFSDVADSLVDAIASHVVDLQRTDLSLASICTAEDLQRVSPDIRTLEVVTGCFNEPDASLDLTRFSSLKHLRVEANSCRGVRELRVESMTKLRSITVADNTFTPETVSVSKQVANRARERHGTLVIRKNPYLASVLIGSNSFVEFTELLLEGLVSLFSSL